MPAANMMENLQLPALQVPEPQGAPEGSPVWSSSSTPTLRRRRFKMRRMRNVQEQSLEAGLAQDLPGVLAPGKEFLQLPSIEITPSSDEDTPWSNCSTPSASPRRKRFLLRKWLRVRERKECSESSSQQSSQQSSHDDDSTRFLSPRAREESTASNSNRSTPACSPILRKRSRSPTPQNPDGDAMVEKGSDHSSDKSPSTPEQGVQRSCSSQSGRSGGKNSKSHKRLSKKSQSWYNVLSPTYKQRNEDFRKLFKQLPDTERLIVDYSCALQRDILLQGRLYLSENWICFYSNIFRWETLLTVRLKDICSMTKEKTARLIPNAIQVCTDSEKHFFTSFGARDRTYMMMFRLWQNALLEKVSTDFLTYIYNMQHRCEAAFDLNLSFPFPGRGSSTQEMADLVSGLYLRVSTELRYRKQPWGLVKTFIEKNFWSGLEDYFRHLESELTKTESTYLAEMHRQSPKEKVSKPTTVRRRKRPHAHLRVPHLEEVMSPVTTPTDEDVGHRIKHVAGSTQTRHIPEDAPNGFHLQSVSKLLLVISCVLVLLVILNMMLFYKLWMLEYTTQTLTAWQGLRLQERLPQSQTEWAQLLESQQKYHDTELQKWREIIKSSVMLLDQMKDSLINLQNGIRSRDYASESEEKRNRFH
ncbi:PREDICTED: GRAM domain-containing protein 1B [Ceratotherium simum simum]|uniref:GRAM domain-containing protein 1B n=1 Tax=Ceratotherium simum simum TaxID=73337 RepID=A0ABM1CLR3_CERSS|nr:PREDICTED: GRAM domain-containing protein 1B [Ceratotherium simum simum]